MSAISNHKPSFKDRIIPWYFVLAFLIVFTVNGIFIYFAISSSNGVVTENAYEKGLQYNQTIKKANEQEALGWKSKINYIDNNLTFLLFDKSDTPCTKASVIAHISRPVGPPHSIKIRLVEVVNGIYEGKIELPLKGQWNIEINALWKKQSYQTQKRLVVQ